MPYVSIHVDAEDVLEDLSDEYLAAEVERRRKRKDTKKGHGDVVPWTMDGFADDLRSAFYARNAARFEAILHAFAPPEFRMPAASAIAAFSQPSK